MTKLELATAIMEKWHPDWSNRTKAYFAKDMATHRTKETLQKWYNREVKQEVQAQ